MKTYPLYLSVLLVLWAYAGTAKAQGAYNPETPEAEADTTAPLGDTVTLYTVQEIVVEGNRRTKEAIILRELTFRLNHQYTLDKLAREFRKSRRFLINTGLFHDVVIALNNAQDTTASVRVMVKERWYIHPSAFIKAVDQNKMDVRRVNYGLMITHRNFTGRNDRLHLQLVHGFNHQVVLRYEGLYLDKALRWSAGLGAAFGKAHTLGYATANHRRLEYRDNNRYVQTFFRPTASVTYRPALKTRHIFSAGYHYEKIIDSVYKLNPYYANGQKTIQFPELSYTLAYTDVDFLPYPLKGTVGEVSLVKKGLNRSFNLWELSAKASSTWPLSQKYFLNVRAAGMLKMPSAQPYIMQRFLGYNGLEMQGLEDYVLDGAAGAYGKVVFLRQLVNTSFGIPSERIKRLNHVPLRIYAKVFGNAGYVHHPDAKQHHLNNRLLCSGGFGIDIVTLTDFVVKLEWSFNQFGENGLNLRRRTYY